MFRTIIIIFVLLFSFNRVSAQELFCKIQIQTPTIQGIDPSVFDAMKTSMYEFMNNRKWSDMNLKMEERIECTIILTITQATQGGDQFSGNINLVVQRPVFGTSYNSLVVNIVDENVSFRYVPFQSMEFSDNSFSDNFTSILAYYAYLVLGLELDTFGKYQGTPYYQKAQAVATTAQSSNEPGWQAYESQKNRALLVENLLNQTFQAQRDFFYDYHRLGMDVMSKDVEGGRRVILKTLDYLQQIYNLRPGLYSFQVILEAKRQEIINIFSEASPAEKIEMLNIMKEIDPPNGTKYEQVMK